ncbi:hypothetical protein [Nitrosopumilus sp. b2]|uniref:hypothetical protein n=1 Tax=Nitrosopumilus sp. b2 TaxID=2109908 RepID=UPI0015F3B8A4|nr:hypothetical protein [Nitrosopumilus sp. b2]KAF6245798.1 hypothetical protein C6989_01300 [Nitrosopumilus sp. b2]
MSSTQFNTKNPLFWIVFLFSVSIVLISLISVVFPAILVSSEPQIPGVIDSSPNPFEVGVWAGPLITTNVIVFIITFFYFKNKLPSGISKLFEKLFKFEISKKIATIILVIVLSAYIIVTIPELQTDEEWADFPPIEKRISESIRDNRFTIEDAISDNPNYPIFEPHTNYTLLIISEKVFGNLKVIPFLASIILLITTYFITTSITNKRFAGIISMIVLIQSNVFLSYDTSPTYSNFWIMFYLLSLYFVYRVWPLSPIAYILSIPAKALTAVFLPLSLYFILRSNISKNKKIILLISTSVIIIIGGLALVSGSIGEVSQSEEFDEKEFWMGFTSFSYQLRFDGLVILFMLPLIVGLFIASRNRVKHADSLMVLISGMLIIAPIITAFTDQTNQPYRFVPLVTFFAIGVGILLSRNRLD